MERLWMWISNIIICYCIKKCKISITKKCNAFYGTFKYLKLSASIIVSLPLSFFLVGVASYPGCDVNRSCLDLCGAEEINSTLRSVSPRLWSPASLGAPDFIAANTDIFALVPGGKEGGRTHPENALWPEPMCDSFSPSKCVSVRRVEMRRLLLLYGFTFAEKNVLFAQSDRCCGTDESLLTLKKPQKNRIVWFQWEKSCSRTSFLAWSCLG